MAVPVKIEPGAPTALVTLTTVVPLALMFARLFRSGMPTLPTAQAWANLLAPRSATNRGRPPDPTLAG